MGRIRRVAAADTDSEYRRSHTRFLHRRGGPEAGRPEAGSRTYMAVEL